MSLFNKFGFIKRSHILSQRGQNFLQAPWAGGIVLVVCVIIAMLLANLPATAELYHHLLHMELGLWIDGELFPDKMTLEKVINDGLMVVFFFTVGLEIRREISHGQLSTPKKAILPIFAALGGMLVPALIFIALNHGTEVSNGWGIPTATDIAFAIGIMSLLGNRVPISLKVFLTALAVADDLGAIFVIAMFYGETPNMLRSHYGRHILYAQVGRIPYVVLPRSSLRSVDIVLLLGCARHNLGCGDGYAHPYKTPI